MRVVLDTNVVASALLWGGTPERLIELVGEGILELFSLARSPRGPRQSFSGDADLRALGTYSEIPILTPAECLQSIGG